MDQDEPKETAPAREARGGKRKSQGQSFAFVEYAGPGTTLSPSSESIIRRHAMKEIGKSRQRPKPTKTVELDLAPLQKGQNSDGMLSWWLGRFWKQADCGVLDPFVKFPIKIDSVAQRLISNVFQDDGGQQRPLRDAWFTVGLEDEAAFLQVLANSALHLDSMQRGGQLALESSDSLWYHARALNSVQSRIAEGIASDGLIGAVTGFMAYADIAGSSEAWSTHHDGLKKLVELRGGVDKIEKNAHLRVTISWCELRGIYMLDSPPVFPLPAQWAYTLHPSLEPAEWQQIKCTAHSMRQWLADADEMVQIYEDLAAYSVHTFRTRPADTLSTGSIQNGAWVNPMIHRVLSWRPAMRVRAQDTVVQETFRLGALLYLAPVWRSFGVAPVVTRTVVGNLRALVTQEEVDWSGAWKLKLWALFMGSCEALGSTHQAWYTTMLSSTLREGRFSSWSAAMSQVKEILLVDELCAEQASTLEIHLY